VGARGRQCPPLHVRANANMLFATTKLGRLPDRVSSSVMRPRLRALGPPSERFQVRRLRSVRMTGRRVGVRYLSRECSRVATERLELGTCNTESNSLTVRPTSFGNGAPTHEASRVPSRLWPRLIGRLTPSRCESSMRTGARFTLRPRSAGPTLHLGGGGSPLGRGHKLMRL
jgi:hypothetical protein